MQHILDPYSLNPILNIIGSLARLFSINVSASLCLFPSLLHIPRFRAVLCSPDRYWRDRINIEIPSRFLAVPDEEIGEAKEDGDSK